MEERRESEREREREKENIHTNSSASLKEFPMSGTGGRVKCSRVTKNLSAFTCKDLSILGETNIVTDTDTDLTVRGGDDREAGA